MASKGHFCGLDLRTASRSHTVHKMLVMIDTMVYVKSALIGWFSLQWNPFNRVTNGPKNLAVLKGDRINEGFLQENVWQFCGAPQKNMAVLTR